MYVKWSGSGSSFTFGISKISNSTVVIIVKVLLIHKIKMKTKAKHVLMCLSRHQIKKLKSFEYTKWRFQFISCSSFNKSIWSVCQSQNVLKTEKKLSFFIGVVVSQIKMFAFVTREKCSIYIWHIPFHKYCNMDVTHEIHFTYVKVCTHLSDIKKKTNIWIWIRTNAMRISFCFSFFAEIQWIWA